MERNISGWRWTFPKAMVAKQTSRPSPTTTSSKAGRLQTKRQTKGKCDYTNCPADILERFQLLSAGGGRFLGQQNEEDEEGLHHRRMSQYFFTPFDVSCPNFLFSFSKSASISWILLLAAEKRRVLIHLFTPKQSDLSPLPHLPTTTTTISSLI